MGEIFEELSKVSGNEYSSCLRPGEVLGKPWLIIFADVIEIAYFLHTFDGESRMANCGAD